MRLLHYSIVRLLTPGRLRPGFVLRRDSTKRMMTALASLMGRDHCVFPNSRPVAAQPGALHFQAATARGGKRDNP